MPADVFTAFHLQVYRSFKILTSYVYSNMKYQCELLEFLLSYYTVLCTENKDDKDEVDIEGGKDKGKGKATLRMAGLTQWETTYQSRPWVKSCSWQRQLGM